MALPHAHPYQEPPTDGDTAAIGDVTDRRLWALAAAVAAAHRAGADGRCTNLQCHGQPSPCGPARNAHAAAQLARRRPPDSPQPSPPADRHPARGRAAVPCGPSGLAGLLDPPQRTAPVDAATDRSVFAPFRRPVAAATRQHHQEEERP
jgi:hypothetical protein